MEANVHRCIPTVILHFSLPEKSSEIKIDDDGEIAVAVFEYQTLLFVFYPKI